MADVSPAALDAVAVAFGLARSGHTAATSRLLASTDHTTLQVVVLNGHRQFREKTLNVAVPGRSAAIDLLRDYLRLCLPSTIEASINQAIAPYREPPR